MKVKELLDQICLREIEASETIKNNALFDMQMVITELGFLEFALISLAISKVDRGLAEAGVDVASFKDNMHHYLNNILVDSVSKPGKVKEFDESRSEDYEFIRYSQTVDRLHKNMLNRYYNALEEQYINEERDSKVVPFPKREE
ncbi:hypothetical protein [uncultured Alteromonas sp.]|uniref:hypothetical protein n=1 Tax=uncultured Alteromonas sp. TaxID=179113 RepID=UPI0030CE1AF2|tara:strand:+ start:29009 stop:29440 length:432 start_codon:yes stop_codon:yes gene_type:complete